MKHQLSYSQKEEKLKLSLLNEDRILDTSICNEDMLSIDERVHQLLGFINKSNRPATNMLIRKGESGCLAMALLPYK